MAWIKMQTHLLDKPEVLGIGERLEIPDAHVIGLLYHVWSMADSQADDGGRIKNCSLRLIDRRVGHEGFAAAMEGVGWLVVDGGDIVFPDYREHNGSTAKTRAADQKRSQKYRKNKSGKEGVTAPSRSTMTQPRPDKNREDKIRGEETLEDHKCIEGGVGGEIESPVYEDDWGEALIEQVRQVAVNRYGFLRDAGCLAGDRVTLLRLAALEAGGGVAEAWIADGCTATREAMANKKIRKTNTGYLYAVLRETSPKYNGGATIERLLAPVSLPSVLTSPPPLRRN